MGEKKPRSWTLTAADRLFLSMLGIRADEEPGIQRTVTVIREAGAGASRPDGKV